MDQFGAVLSLPVFSRFPLVFPAYDLTRSPPSEHALYRSERLEKAIIFKMKGMPFNGYCMMN